MAHALRHRGRMSPTQSVQTRAIALNASNDEVSCVVASETPVPRNYGDEVLQCTPDAVNLERAPLPLIVAHDAQRLPIGIVDSIRAEAGVLRGKVRFGTSPEALQIAADVAAGIVRNLSVGYSVEEWREEPAGTFTATRWTPHEVSIVAIPADARAGFNRSKSMSETPEAVVAERQRARDITTICHTLKHPHLASDFIERGLTIEQVQKKLVDLLAEMDAEVGELDNKVSEAAARSRDHFVEAAADGLLMRSGLRLANAHPAARDFRAMDLREIASTCLARANVRTAGMGRQQLFVRAMGTADFPELLANALNKAMKVAFEREPASHVAWVKMTTTPDFRDQRRIAIGNTPDLQRVLELDEYTHGYIAESAESFEVRKYGRLIRLSFEAMVNDDLGAFVNLPRGFGQAARRREADQVYELLSQSTYAGVTMSDTKSLFHTDHANITTATSGAALSFAYLAEARALLRKQTTLDGAYINGQPRFLIVSADDESNAEALLAAAGRYVTDSGADDSARPKWVSALQLVVEPRLAKGASYLATDAQQVDHIELATLEEQAGGPFVEEIDETNVDAKTWKIRHVFGVGAVDYRGIVRVTYP